MLPNYPVVLPLNFFLQERIDFFNALETALYEESENSDECTKDQVISAILATDPECTESAARSAADSACMNGAEKTPIKVAMKTLSRGMLKGGCIGGNTCGRGSLSNRSLSFGKSSTHNARGSLKIGGARNSQITASGSSKSSKLTLH